MTPIDVNPRPDTSPEDQEVLRRVYQAQMDEYQREHVDAAKRLETANFEYGKAQAELDIAARAEAVLTGKIDALRQLAARDGVQLD